MEISSAILIISSIANFALGFLVFIRNKRDPINILYGVIALGVSIWCASIYFFRAAADITLFWSKIAYLSAAASAFLFLYFTLYFPFKTKINSLIN